ncbi:hypothetical protein AYI70_g12430 [Smittium culicis]|uniref:Uncharacterized protein n=1 Tax=Smittium culicis TaxID=133412 RepID=A0A1R1WXM3_9FUNG|nr:hypothetical protein AYI70_g12430 [Smittium culicis]
MGMLNKTVYKPKIVQSDDESNNEWDNDKNESDFIDVEENDDDSDLDQDRDSKSISRISNFDEKNRIIQEPTCHRSESKKMNSSDKLFGHMIEYTYDDKIE